MSYCTILINKKCLQVSGLYCGPLFIVIHIQQTYHLSGPLLKYRAAKITKLETAPSLKSRIPRRSYPCQKNSRLGGLSSLEYKTVIALVILDFEIL